MSSQVNPAIPVSGAAMAATPVRQNFVSMRDEITQLQAGQQTGPGQVPFTTTERDTGLKWVDGKPIYQITHFFESGYGSGHGITAARNPGATATLPFGLSIVEELVHFDFVIMFAEPIEIRYGEPNPGYLLAPRVEGSDVKITNNSGKIMTYNIAIITLRYTKA